MSWFDRLGYPGYLDCLNFDRLDWLMSRFDRLGYPGYLGCPNSDHLGFGRLDCPDYLDYLVELVL